MAGYGRDLAFFMAFYFLWRFVFYRRPARSGTSDDDFGRLHDVMNPSKTGIGTPETVTRAKTASQIDSGGWVRIPFAGGYIYLGPPPLRSLSMFSHPNELNAFSMDPFS